MKTKKILKPFLVGKYLTVTFCDNGKCKDYSVHRLVAEAFLSNPNSYPQVNHKDEITTNNCVDNLEWCTAKYNANYGHRLDWCKKEVICLETGKIYASVGDCARDMNICSGDIVTCCNHNFKRLSAKGYHFCYTDSIKSIQDIENTRQRPSAKKIKCLELDREYDAIVDAARDLKLNQFNISACLNGRQHTTGGYHWIYVGDNA